MNAPSSRPPEIVAASEEPLQLTGEVASVDAPVPAQTEATLQGAVDDPTDAQRIYVNVEDIEAEADPGVVYGVYLNRPPDVTGADADRYHIGNVSLFGIEAMNDPDRAHADGSALRHTFDVTKRVNQLEAEGAWDPARVTITFEPLTLVAPSVPPGPDPAAGPGEKRSAVEARAVIDQALAEAVEQNRVWGAERPVTIGRVSVFVG